VEGRIWSGEGIGSHNKTTNFVYEQLRLRGLLETDIRYFNYDTSQPGVAGVPTRAAVQEAVTQWARDKMNQKPANLYIVLVDHGSTDSFYIDPEVISSADLASWLTSLQNSLRGDAVTQEIVVLLGFCRSGSFLQSLGGWKRVCLASAAPDEASYKGPLDPEDPGGVRDGEFFVTEFFKSAAVGKSVYDSFREAVVRTRLFTSSGTGTPNGPYSDDARQHPLLDDNGDGAGSNLPTGEPGEDGNLGKGLYVGVSSITHNDPGDVQVTSVGETQFLGASDTGAGFWAAVSDNQRMRSLWVEVKPPGYDPPETGTDQVAMDLAAHSYDTYNQAEDRYQWNPIPEFNTSGTYQVFYFARDNLTGNLSSLKEGIVYKAKAGNQPPGAFDLLSPADGEEVPTTLALLWSDSADPEGDGITYTVEIARDEQFTEVVHRAERISETRYLVEPSAGLQDLSSYFWRVIAVDSYGAATTSNQARHFDTNNTNANFAWINSRATDSTSRAALTNAVLKADSEAFTHVGSGHYQVKLDLGGKEGKAVRLTAEAPGYTPIVTEGVVHVGKYTNKDFTLEPRSPETPTFSPPGRITTQALNVAVSCATAEAVIRYTTDGSEPTEASTSYTAPIPVSATTTLKAKAYVAGWAPSKTATATYTLVPILVISPNGGEHWTAGENRRISWKYGTGAGDTVTIELVKGDAATTLFSNVPVGSGGTGSCWWKIPVDQKAGETYRIRITGSGVGAPRDNSDAAFGILASGVQPTLTVVFPVSGTVWKRGNAPRIKWTYTGYPGPYVNIKLFRGAELVKNIVSKVGIGSGGRGFYQWRIPTSLKAGTRYRLQVTSTRTPTCTDTSDGWFTIQ